MANCCSGHDGSDDNDDDRHSYNVDNGGEDSNDMRKCFQGNKDNGGSDDG